MVDKFPEKEIYEHVIEWSPGETDDEGEIQRHAIELRDGFIANITAAIAGGARTLIVDTESRLWQIYRYAEFGGPNSGSIKDYDTLNQRFEDFINKVKGAEGVNLFLIRSMKNKWGQTGEVSRNTGKRSMRVEGREVWGYEHLPSIVMTELFFRLNEEADIDPEDPNSRYVIDIGKCRHDLSLQHTTVPRMEFARLGQMFLPGTKKKDWL